MAKLASRVCRECGADNRAIARLCDQCGSKLSTAPPTASLSDDRYQDLQRAGVTAARVLNQTYSVSYRLMEHRLRGVDISVAQFRALSLVKRTPPPLTPSLLALHLALDARTASDLIGRLEQAGWLRRVKDLPDRRAARLELTPDGEVVLARAWEPMIDAMEEVWQEIPTSELLPVIDVLIRVRDRCLERLGYSTDEIFALGPRSPLAAALPATNNP